MKSVLTARSTSKRPWMVFAVLVALLLLMRIISTSGNAQSPTAETKPQAKDERVIEFSIPDMVPLKVKIKEDKEAALKSLANEKWARDYEFEITNTGTKPIYYLYLVLVSDVNSSAGYPFVFGFSYGRVELGRITVMKAQSDDVPIMPGESFVFTIHPSQLEAWEKIQLEEHLPQPKKLRLDFQILSFGDGTGFTNSTPIPNPWNKRSLLQGCGRSPNKGSPGFDGQRFCRSAHPDFT